MSAFYAVCENDSVHMMCDGALYADDGTLVALKEKVFRAIDIPMAMVGSGDDWVVGGLGAMMTALSAGRSVDGTMEALSAFIREARPTLDRACFGILIGCISETDGPKLFFMTNHAESARAKGLDCYEFHDVGKEFGGGPQPDTSMLKAFDLDGGLVGERFCDFGVRVFCAMRFTKMEHVAHPDKPMLYAVGGHVDYTIVDAAGTETVRILEWPDIVGEKIDPFKGEIIFAGEAPAAAA